MVQAFTRAHPDLAVRSLAYRGLRPLISPRAFQVGGRLQDGQAAQLWAEQDGMLAHQADITFARS